MTAAVPPRCVRPCDSAVSMPVDKMEWPGTRPGNNGRAVPVDNAAGAPAGGGGVERPMKMAVGGRGIGRRRRMAVVPLLWTTPQNVDGAAAVNDAARPAS